MNVGSERTVKGWYALSTKPKQEFRAESNLKAWRVETFFPKVNGRRRDCSGERSTTVVKPLFPGYIFARFDLESLLHKVVFTRGVRSVVSFGGTPTMVEDKVINFLQTRVGDDGTVKLDDEFKPGDRVIIQEGHFKNFVGVLDGSVKEVERVRILLLTISSQIHVTVAKDWLKKQLP
jgi:transcriptional antiterminator RfaH